VSSQVYIQVSGVHHCLYIRWIQLVSTRVKSPIRSGVTSGVQYTYIHVSGKDKQLQYIMNSLLLLCQRTPIATCNRRIPYYAYHTCQSGS